MAGFLLVLFMHDLVIVGAGPVGTGLAALCAGKMEILVLEEDERSGKKACSGLVSERFMEMLPRNVRNDDIIRHEVKAAIIHFMGKEMEFRKKEHAYVLDRERLDVLMADNAEDCGAQIMYGEKVARISSTGRCVSAHTARRVFDAHVVAGCDGARSVVAQHMKTGPSEIVNGLIIYEKKRSEEDFVEMWFDKSIVKDGFFWKIPRGDSMEYGCMGKALSFPILEKFFGVGEGPGISRAAAPIPIGNVQKSHADGLILAGDAAGQTKPWSGGGLAYGMIAAGCAAEAICRAVSVRDFSAGSLSAYEKSWKCILHREIQAGMFIREVLKDMNPRAICSLIDGAERMRKKAHEIDFDFPLSGILGAAPGAVVNEK